MVCAEANTTEMKRRKKHHEKVSGDRSTLALCLGLCSMAAAETTTYKVGILAPAVTHGWVAGVAYHAEQRCKELADTIEYKFYTSSSAEEMTTQLDDLKTWGAQAIVAYPQWEGMEVPIQAAIDEGIYVVNFDIDIDAKGVYKVTGDNEGMGYRGREVHRGYHGTEGTVVALSVPTSGSVSELRMKGFTETMAEIAPNVKIIEYATEFSREAGLKDMADILTANPQIDAVYSLDDETSIGALQAIEDAGRTDIKAITGGGGCQEYFNIIKEKADEIHACSALYSPLMIKDCLDVALSVLGGETVDAVKVIPSQIVDATNVDEYIDPSNTIY